MEHQAGLNGQDLSNYYTWMLERTLETMQHQGTWVIIIDLEGWNLGVCVVCVCACARVCARAQREGMREQKRMCVLAGMVGYTSLTCTTTKHAFSRACL